MSSHRRNRRHGADSRRPRAPVAGRCAAAEVHYKVKEDIAKADQHLIASGFDQLFTLVTLLNFGPDTPPPRFTYEKMEPLHAERAERDKRLHDMGVRFNTEYFATHYKIDPTQIEVQNPAPSFTTVGRGRHFSRRQNNETVADFTARLERAGQDTIDDIIDDFQAEIDNAKSFEDAANRILKRYQRQFKHRSKLAAILDNLRYVAASAGASNAKE